jgi:hypothetical protein
LTARLLEPGIWCRRRTIGNGQACSVQRPVHCALLKLSAGKLLAIERGETLLKPWHPGHNASEFRRNVDCPPRSRRKFPSRRHNIVSSHDLAQNWRWREKKLFIVRHEPGENPQRG